MVTRLADDYPNIAARLLEIQEQEKPNFLKSFVVPYYSFTRAGDFAARWFDSEILKTSKFWRESDDSIEPKEFMDNSYSVEAYVSWFSGNSPAKRLGYATAPYCKGAPYKQENIRIVVARLTELNVLVKKN